MSPLRRVPSLKRLSLQNVAILVRDSVLRYARILVLRYQDLCSTALDQIICDFRDFIFLHVASTLTHRVSLEVLKGIDLAVEKKSLRLKRDLSSSTFASTCKAKTFSQELYYMVCFSDLIAIPSLRTLTIADVSSALRPQILVSSILKMKGLWTLNLGYGSIGLAVKVFHDRVLAAIKIMNQLTDVTINYDCSDLILMILADNCGHSIRKLNVDFSQYVTDYSAKTISRFSKLSSLSTRKTGLSSNAKIMILMSLKDTLRYFDQGEFLSFFRLDEPHCLSFNLRELIWTSMHYPTLALCPRISKVIVPFQPGISYMTLAKCLELNEISNYGGWFHRDISMGLKLMPRQFFKLSLNNVAQIDREAIKCIYTFCPNLLELSIRECHTSSSSSSICWSNIPPMKLRVLTLFGDFSMDLINFILKPVRPTLTTLQSGPRMINDSVFLNQNDGEDCHWKELKDLNIQDPVKFSLGSLYEMVEKFSNLRRIRNLDNWKCLPKTHVSHLKRFIRVNNFRVIVDDDETEDEEED